MQSLNTVFQIESYTNGLTQCAGTYIDICVCIAAAIASATPTAAGRIWTHANIEVTCMVFCLFCICYMCDVRFRLRGFDRRSPLRDL